MIWFKEYKLEDLSTIFAGRKTIIDVLGIKFTQITSDSLIGTMPVDERTHQPYGILHGGATCVLTETLGSVASGLVIDPSSKMTVGSVIMTNHLRPVSAGIVTGICKPVHLGRTKHVWDILVNDERGKLIAKTELTCAVMDK